MLIESRATQFKFQYVRYPDDKKLHFSKKGQISDKNKYGSGPEMIGPDNLVLQM